MSDKPQHSGPVVAVSTIVRSGFTMSPHARSWAITRPFSTFEIARLGTGSAASRMLASHPEVHAGLHGTAAALEAALRADVPTRKITSLLGQMMSDGLLLAPFVGVSRGWHFHLSKEAQSLVARLEALAGATLPPKGRRMAAKMWLCTVEGKAIDLDRDAVRRFVEALQDTEDDRRWMEGFSENVIEGAKALALAFQVIPASRKYSQLSRRLGGALENPKLAVWASLHEQFLESRNLGSISRYQNGFKHFLAYLIEHPEVSEVSAFFSRAIKRPPLSSWISDALNVGNAEDVLTGLSLFFNWVVSNDESLSMPDEHGHERVANSGVYIPLHQAELEKLKSNKDATGEDPSDTVQLALPLEYMDEVASILFDDDMAWPKRRRADWIEWPNPATGQIENVYCPVLPHLISLLVNLPIRQVQARRLDSGEGDAETFDPLTSSFVVNTGPHAGYWHGQGVAQPLRGALRRIDDTISKETLCGIYVNSNKTADRRVLFDERSGYVIEWHNLPIIEIVLKTRSWQEKYNPVDGPLEYGDVRTGVFEKMAKGVAARRPACFYLFRYPAGNTREFRSSPPSSQQLRMFWYEVLGELERRLKEQDPAAPNLISTWLGRSPQASPYTLHGLRHGGLTRLAMAGVHPWILQNIVAGHAAWVMTLYYIKPNAAHISASITEGYHRAALRRQEEMKEFLSTKTLEEAHRIAVGSDDAFLSIQQLRNAKLPNIVGQLASLDHGICPNGRTRCREGCLITKLTERSVRELRDAYGPVPATVGGKPDCTQCRFFLTGTPFMEGLRLRTNEVSLAASKAGERYHELRTDVDHREAAKARAKRDGQQPDLTAERTLHMLRRELKAQAEILADLGLSVDSHAKKWQQVLALARTQKAAGQASVPALLFEEVPEFDWGLQPRFEAVDEICAAATWFRSLHTTELRAERRETVLRALVRNGRPPALAMMTQDEADVAAAALMSALYMRLGQTATRKIFEDQATFESLGFVDDVEEIMATAIGKPVSVLLGKAPDLELAQSSGRTNGRALTGPGMTA